MNSLALSGGIAIFAMLFGAGNIVFPLDIGRQAGDMALYALAGFVVTAIMVPLVGLIGSMLFDGDYNTFFNRLGKIPGEILVGICMLMLTVGVARCITVSHGAVGDLLNNVSLYTFSAAAVALIFVSTFKRGKILGVLGYVLGPVKLLLLAAIVIKGLLSAQPLAYTCVSGTEMLTKGFVSGYSTFDLIGTIFFSSLVLIGLRAGMKNASLREIAIMGIKAGAVGGILLALVYAGFCFVSAKYAAELLGYERQQLFPAISYLVLGSRIGLLANITVAVSCLATSIALTAVTTDYVRKKIFFDRVSYVHALLVVLVAVLSLASIGFEGIMHVVVPVITVCYPAFFVLAICNILNRLYDFKMVKLPVYATIAAVAVYQFDLLNAVMHTSLYRYMSQLIG